MRYRDQSLDQIGRFIVVGILATFVHFLLIVFLVDIVGWCDPATATVFGAACGIATSYLGNHRWVFRRRGRHGLYVPRFGGVYVVVLGVHWAIMSATVDVFHWHYAVGFFVATGVATALTFTGNRTVVFR